MNDFNVTLRPAALRNVRQLPEDIRGGMLAALTSLSSDFRPTGSRRLRTRPGYLWRFDNVTVYYTIDGDLRWVRIVQVLVQTNEANADHAS